jgi:hypothetical protein
MAIGPPYDAFNKDMETWWQAWPGRESGLARWRSEIIFI